MRSSGVNRSGEASRGANQFERFPPAADEETDDRVTACRTRAFIMVLPKQTALIPSLQRHF